MYPWVACVVQITPPGPPSRHPGLAPAPSPPHPARRLPRPPCMVRVFVGVDLSMMMHVSRAGALPGKCASLLATSLIRSPIRTCGPQAYRPAPTPTRPLPTLVDRMPYQTAPLPKKRESAARHAPRAGKITFEDYQKVNVPKARLLIRELGAEGVYDSWIEKFP